jgi:sterol desaturase/sphingolipid hydroxylase (fatty acid hydroxylase superfamily)
MIIGHSGYEYGVDGAGLHHRSSASFIHDQHHQSFRCNYATHFSWWDRMMGTLHPNHDRALKANLSRSRPTPVL